MADEEATKDATSTEDVKDAVASEETGDDGVPLKNRVAEANRKASAANSRADTLQQQLDEMQGEFAALREQTKATPQTQGEEREYTREELEDFVFGDYDSVYKKEAYRRLRKKDKEEFEELRSEVQASGIKQEHATGMAQSVAETKKRYDYLLPTGPRGEQLQPDMNNPHVQLFIQEISKLDAHSKRTGQPVDPALILQAADSTFWSLSDSDRAKLIGGGGSDDEDEDINDTSLEGSHTARTTVSKPIRLDEAPIREYEKRMKDAGTPRTLDRNKLSKRVKDREKERGKVTLGL